MLLQRGFGDSIQVKYLIKSAKETDWDVWINIQ